MSSQVEETMRKHLRVKLLPVIVLYVPFDMRELRFARPGPKGIILLIIFLSNNEIYDFHINFIFIKLNVKVYLKLAFALSD